MSRYLGRDEILSADDRTYEDVPVPEWSSGGETAYVRLRSLTGAERDEWENSMIRQVGKKQVANMRNARAKLVALSAVDEDGQPLFTAADVIKLGSKNAAALDRLFETAQRLSGVSDEDMKELEEGFGETQDEPSASA